MSLIYDYLKIHGESAPEGELAVEIPPILKRNDSNRPNSSKLLIILGACLGMGLFIFFVARIFVPAENVQVAADSRPGLVSLITTGADAVVQQKEEPAPVPGPGVLTPPVDSPPPGPADTFSENTMQVFPETGKPAMEETGIMQKSAVAAVRKKIPQTLELGNRNRKITFPGETPVHTEGDVTEGEVVQDFPFHGDVAVQGVSPASDSSNNAVDVSSRAIRESSSADDRFYSFAKPDPAALNKGKKFYQAGLQAQQSGDQRVAEIYYMKALDEQPLHLEAMINLSALYVQQQRYAEAEKVLADILRIYPGNSKALVNMGMISLYNNNELLAEEQFQAALAVNPIEENAMVNLAYLAEKRMDYVSAEGYYRNLLQISPDNIEVLLAYGHLLEEEMRYPEAVAVYEDCLKLDNVMKEQVLYDKITRRMRMLAGAGNRR